ncbi:phosphoglucosamine mutase [Intestinimonas butyriciproducens]|uniref:phosphoglucosamine mutase n=1 Tax=Intestinimonas butyriciproducens TaxID=1297617 RepID=UPI00242C2FA0|nr:phosphoglucosamine mutase [Intestinimonas butyriciproducens]
MGKLFGTDGIRGVVNAGLDAALAFQVGLATAQVLGEGKPGKKPLVTIGKDTRISSDLLEGALVAGLCSAGSDVLHLGVIPTPAVAWITVDQGADAGVVISASHNPFEHNGIKIFNGQGFKLSDELEGKIEDIILSGAEVSLKTGGEIGRVTYAEDRTRDDYIDHLASTVEDGLAGLRILVDCANGAASATAPQLFDRFDDLHCDIINADPDGININTNCGSTHLEGLAAMVKAGGYDLGLAFDGDADRFLAVSEAGIPIDGDQVMAVCGRYLKSRGKLAGDTIVATVMSNIGLHRFAAENNMEVVCTDVGDRNVLERMLENGFSLGGEQSGHMIFLEHATTGDGQLTALQFLNILHQSRQPASKLVADCRQYPQVLVNVAVADNAQKQAVMGSVQLKDAIAAGERALAGNGRILVRPSGTEALIRVMVEAETEGVADSRAQELANLIKKL